MEYTLLWVLIGGMCGSIGGGILAVLIIKLYDHIETLRYRRRQR